MAEPPPVLSVESLTVRFGGIVAVNAVDLAVRRGEVFSVIGPNGAGKTTVFNAVTGIYEPTAGRVQSDGGPLAQPLRPRTVAGWALIGLAVGLLLGLAAVNPDAVWRAAIRDNMAGGAAAFPWGKAAADAVRVVTARGDRAGGGFAVGFLVGAGGAALTWRRSRRSPDVVARGGVARTFQNIRLFQSMTALENVLVGMNERLPGGLLGMALRLPAHTQAEADARREAGDLLAFVGLAGKHNELAQNLPYGDQRRLEIARALATNPRLLLLDEPAAGMNPTETAGLMALIRAIRDRGVTVVLIEHHMSLVMGVSDRVAVLDHGVKIAEGTPAEVSRDPAVIEAYLGKEEVT